MISSTHMRERVIGYIGLALLIAFCIATTALAMYTFTIPITYRTVRFLDIGSLGVQDPVAVLGHRVGEICKIQWHNRMAHVTIATTTPIEIHSDYTISVIDLGVMGDRLLSVQCGSPLKPIVGSLDTLHGTFGVGPSEALALMGEVRIAVVTLQKLSEILFYGNKKHPSLIKQYREIVVTTDSLTLKLQNLAEKLTEQTSTALDTLAEVLYNAQAIATALKATVPNTLAQATVAERTLDSLLIKTDSLVYRIRPWLMYALDERSELSTLLYNIQNQMIQTQQTIRHLQSNGLNLKIWPF